MSAPEPRLPGIVRITRRDGTVSTFTASTRKHPRKTDRPDGDALPPEPIPLPVSVEDFRALVADLRAELAAARPIDRERLIRRTATPEAFTGRPWAWNCITLAEAAPLTGRAKGTLRKYSKPHATGPKTLARNGQAGRDFPPMAARDERPGAARTPAGLWEAGALALWCALRNEGRSQRAIARAARSPYQQPRPPKGGAKGGAKRDGTWARSLSRRRVAALAFMRALVREDTAVTLEDATGRIAAGLDLAGITLPPLLAEARHQETAAFTARLEALSVHPRGWVTAVQVGAVFGTSSTQVMRTWRRGELVAAGMRGRGLPLFDPSRLRCRSQMTRWGYSRSPADRDSPYAMPVPGDVKDDVPF